MAQVVHNIRVASHNVVVHSHVLHGGIRFHSASFEHGQMSTPVNTIAGDISASHRW